MSIAEKLVTVSENTSRAAELNRDLETILAGGDTGGKSEMDEFWDVYQENGNRTQYERSFAGTGWTEDTFKPKYDMRPTIATGMFRFNRMQVDLVEYLEDLGINLDFSSATALTDLFTNTMFTHIGVVNVSATKNLQQVFSNTRAVTIDKLVLREDGLNTFASTFNDSTKLENITIEGAIGQNMDVHWSTKLTHDSLMSIINHLQTKASGSFVLTLGTTNLAKLTDAEKAIASGKGWTLA